MMLEMSEESEIKALRREVEMLREHVQLLALSKLTDPRYAYWSLLVQDQIDDERRERLETVLDYLNERAEDPDAAADSHSAAEAATGRSLPRAGAVEKAEVDELVGIIFDSKRFDASEMLAAAAAQGRWLDLAEQLLPSFLVS